MTTLVLLNDCHLAIRNPVSRTADYNTEVFQFLDQALRLAVKVNAAGILIAGDLFHDKQERSRLPYAILMQLVQWLMQCRLAGIVVLAIPGNHDLLHDRYDSLPGRPLGILFEAGLLVNVSRRWAPVGNVRVYGVPWPDALEPDAFAAVPDDVDLVMAHGFATVEGGTMYGDYCHRYGALGGAAPRVRLWHFGHDHTDHGVSTLANGAKVVNIGALSRGAMNTDNIIRQVKVAVARIPPDGPVDVTQVALRQEPAEYVFDLKLRQQKALESAQIDAFVQQLSTGLLNLSVDYADTLRALPLSDAVRAKVDEYIRRAETV